MKSKTLSLFIAGLIATAFLISFASAAISFSNVPTLSNSAGTHTSSITILSDQNETVHFSVATNTDTSGITFSPISDVVLNSSNSSKVVDITYTIPSTFNFAFNKEYSVTLTATGTNSSAVNQILSFTKNTNYCTYNHSSDLSIDDLSFTNKGINGFKIGDDNKWYPLTEVQVEFTVRNDNPDDDLRSTEVRWALYDNSGKLIMDGKESKFTVRNDDEEPVDFTFKLTKNLDDLTDGTYTFYVKASGELDNSNNDNICAEDSDSVEIVVENDLVILDNLEFDNSSSCYSPMHITGDVWNIGSDKQNDVYVTIRNTELGINQQVNIGDINSMDNEKLDVTFNLPPNMSTTKAYGVQFEVYDENNDVYVTSDDDESIFTLPISVVSCEPQVNAFIAGEVQSGGQSGKDLVVKATITNTGKSLTTFTLTPLDYTGWASSVSLDQSLVAVEVGQSKDVLLTFKTNSDAAGTYNFNLELLSGGSVVTTQPFQVTLEKSSAFGNFDFGSNWYLWLIGALNVILIIIIIVVAVRVARR